MKSLLYRGDADEYILQGETGNELSAEYSYSWALAPAGKTWGAAKARAQSPDDSIVLEDDPDRAGQKRLRVRVTPAATELCLTGAHQFSVTVDRGDGDRSTYVYGETIWISDAGSAGAP